MAAPRLIFLAGPNGAGKSTFYETFLRDSGLPFVNADRITAAEYEKQRATIVSSV